MDDYPRKNIQLDPGETVDDKGKAYAEFLTSPELSAYRVIESMQPGYLGKDIDVPTLLKTLAQQIATVNNGDTGRSEAMLISQATALQSVFVRLSELALQQERISSIESFMRLALKAQAQCRSTLETLAGIKYPAVVYANQANLTTGPQQVNNYSSREFQIAQNQLSGADNELRPNPRTQSHAGRDDSTLEAVGKIYGPEDR